MAFWDIMTEQIIILLVVLSNFTQMLRDNIVSEHVHRSHDAIVDREMLMLNAKTSQLWAV